MIKKKSVKAKKAVKRSILSPATRSPKRAAIKKAVAKVAAKKK
jgi:hypothetical protein